MPATAQTEALTPMQRARAAAVAKVDPAANREKFLACVERWIAEAQAIEPTRAAELLDAKAGLRLSSPAASKRWSLSSANA